MCSLRYVRRDRAVDHSSPDLNVEKCCDSQDPPRRYEETVAPEIRSQRVSIMVAEKAKFPRTVQDGIVILTSDVLVGCVSLTLSSISSEDP